jgi:5-methylcytosine-specific restriction protein B
VEGLKPVLLESGDLGYEMVDGIFKSICSRAAADRDQNYVIIVDEINRGNISKIFGELITLIETTKRLFQTPREYPQSVLLPYSRNKFSVPNNVYILGTMNSVDRSTTSIDSALRRRFDFIEVAPNPALLSRIHAGNVEIDLSLLLRVLNSRLEILLDRDHLLGHSYFMRVSSWHDLCSVFRNNVIPLLVEYFFGDWKKIALVLGDTPVFQKSDAERFIIQDPSSFDALFLDQAEAGENMRYRLNPALHAELYDEFPVESVLKGFGLNV